MSGVLVASSEVDDWAAAMASFTDPGSPQARRQWAETFGADAFRRRMRDVLESASAATPR